MYNQMEIPYFERYQQQEELAADIHNLTFTIADDDYLIFQKSSGWVEEGAFKRVLTVIYRDTKFVQEEHRRFQFLK